MNISSPAPAENCPTCAVPAAPCDAEITGDGSIVIVYKCASCGASWPTSFLLDVVGDVDLRVIGSSSVKLSRAVTEEDIRTDAGYLLYQAAAYVEQAIDLIEDSGHRGDKVTITMIPGVAEDIDLVTDLAWLVEAAAKLPFAGRLHPLLPGQKTQQQLQAGCDPFRRFTGGDRLGGAA
jgi:hypothetical protein